MCHVRREIKLQGPNVTIKIAYKSGGFQMHNLVDYYLDPGL